MRIYMNRRRLVGLERDLAELVHDLRFLSRTISVRDDPLECLGTGRMAYIKRLEAILHTSERVALSLENQIVNVKRVVKGTEDDGRTIRPNVPGVNLHPIAQPNWPHGVMGSVKYPGPKATKQELACWLAANAKRRGIPPELPIMAALVESGLVNNPHQLDHDSTGFFQMRHSIWDGRYPGYQKHPDKQVDWFLDEAAAVAKRYPGSQHNLGRWCADIERPAAQYRGRYATRYEEAKKLVAGCAAGGGISGPSNGVGGGHHNPHPIQPPTPGATPGAAIINVAHNEAERGPHGSTSAQHQFDATVHIPDGSAWCSAFVAWTMKKSLGSFPPGVNGMAVSWLNVAQPPTTWPRPHPKYRIRVVSPPGRAGDIVYYGGTGGHVGLMSSPIDGRGNFGVIDGNTSRPSTQGGGSVMLVEKSRRVAGNGYVDGYFHSMTIIRIEPI